MLSAVGITLQEQEGAAADERGLLLVLVAGLAANALVCGGLSAPADRYQARVIWALPVLVALFAARRLSEARPRPAICPEAPLAQDASSARK